MPEPSALPLHVILPAAVLLGDLVAAGIVFIALTRRQHPSAFVVPLIIAVAGIFSAAIAYFALMPKP